MEILIRKPVVIAIAVAVISTATLLVVNHTNLIVDWRPPPRPPGTTFNAANSVGATVNPTQPESPIKPTPTGPTPVQPANPTKK